jgi:hypothetical protein
MLGPPSEGLPRVFSLVGPKPGEAGQRYDLANRQDGRLMIDLVDPDGVTAEWLTEVLAAADRSLASARSRGSTLRQFSILLVCRAQQQS